MPLDAIERSKGQRTEFSRIILISGVDFGTSFGVPFGLLFVVLFGVPFFYFQFWFLLSFGEQFFVEID